MEDSADCADGSVPTDRPAFASSVSNKVPGFANSMA